MGLDSPERDALPETSARIGLFTRMPRTVWILCALFTGAMLVWSFARIMFTAPDERAHVGAVLYLEEFHDWPRNGEMPMMLAAMRAADLTGEPPYTAAAATPRPLRTSFAALTDPSNLVSGTSVNQMTQHPPLYYAILAASHAVLGDRLSFDQEMWLWRLFSVLLLAPLPLLSAALARRLGAGPTMTVLAAAMVALVPGLQTIGGAINNDNLLIAASAWALLGAGCVLTGDLRVRTAVWIGAALAVALFTKAFAIPIAVGVVLAYVVALVRRREYRRGFVSLGVVLAVSMLGGWWWLRNILLYGTLQPIGHTDPLVDGPLSFAQAWGRFVIEFTERFFSRLWIGIDGSYSVLAVGCALIVTAAITVSGLVWTVRARPTRGDLVAGVTLLVPAALTFVIVVYQAYRVLVNTGITAGAQGRYLYPALIGAIAVYAIVAQRGMGDKGRRILLAVVAGTGLAATAWRVGVVLTPEGDGDASTLADRFDAVLAWSPLPHAVSISIAVTYLALFVWTVIALVGDVRRPRAAGLTVS